MSIVSVERFRPSLPDEDDLDPLALKVPEPKSTGDTDQDTRNQVHRDTFVAIVDMLCKQPSLRLPALGFLRVEEKARKKCEAERVPEPPFPKSFTTLAKLPADWYCSWIVHESQGLCTKDMLTDIQLRDPDALRRIFDFLTVTTVSTAWPLAAHDRAVLQRMFSHRATDVGDRIRGWFQRALRPDGSVDWQEGGPYTIEFDPISRRAIAVRHISGARKEMPSHILVDGTFELEYGWCDARAQLVKRPTAIKLLDLFPETDRPPRSHVLEKKAGDLHRIADAKARVLAEERVAASTALVLDPTILEGAVAVKRRRGLDKAKDGVTRRNLTKKARMKQIVVVPDLPSEGEGDNPEDEEGEEEEPAMTPLDSVIDPENRPVVSIT